MIAAEPFAPPPRLLPTAVGHLAHDLRGAMHIIRGHAELLGAEAVDDDTRESASEIMDACGRLGSLCDDIVDFLRLPAVAPGALGALALDDLGRTLAPIAAARSVQIRFTEPMAAHPTLLVQSAVRRVVSHVLEHVVRSAAADVTIVAALRPDELQGESCVIVVSPLPDGAAAGDDGITAVAESVLAAHHGHLSVLDDGIELVFPVTGSSS